MGRHIYRKTFKVYSSAGECVVYNKGVNGDQFTRLFKYMEKRFDELDGHIEYVESSMATKESIDTLIAMTASTTKV